VLKLLYEIHKSDYKPAGAEFDTVLYQEFSAQDAKIIVP